MPKRSLQIFGTEGYAKVNLANQSVHLVQIPSWIRNRDFDFDATTLEQQAFVRDNLFSRLLTLQQTEIEPNNAILAEQNDWLDAIRSGSKPRVDVEQGKQAVEIAQQVLDSIARHNWSTTEKGMTGPLASSPLTASAPDPDPVRVSCFVAESCVEAVLSTPTQARSTFAISKIKLGVLRRLTVLAISARSLGKCSCSVAVICSTSVADPIRMSAPASRITSIRRESGAGTTSTTTSPSRTGSSSVRVKCSVSKTYRHS